jgi:outer membrane protein assembly factor BamB
MSMATELKSKKTKRPAKSAPAPATPAGGPHAQFLGGPARTGSFEGSVSRSKPKLLWSCEGAHCDQWGGRVIVKDGVAYTADGNGMVVAVNVKNGKPIFKHNMSTGSGQWYATTDALVVDGVLYQGTNQGLHALDAKTGEQRWHAKLPKVTGSALMIDGLVFVVAKGGLHGLDPATGRKKRSFPLFKEGKGAPAFANGIVYVQGDDRIFAVDFATGKTLWKGEACLVARNMTTAPMVVGEHVFWAKGARELACADGRTGQIIWTASFADLIYTSAFAAADARVFVRDHEGRVHALHAMTGKLAWTFEEETQYGHENGGIAVADGVVFCVANPGLVALDAASGKKLWVTTEHGKNCAVPFVKDGVLYVQGGELNALTI